MVVTFCTNIHANLKVEPKALAVLYSPQHVGYLIKRLKGNVIDQVGLVFYYVQTFGSTLRRIILIYRSNSNKKYDSVLRCM